MASIESEGLGEIIGKVMNGYEKLLNEFIENQSISANKNAMN